MPLKPDIPEKPLKPETPVAPVTPLVSATITSKPLAKLVVPVPPLESNVTGIVQ